MDYKFTFEDGSEAYLAHYGVKGRSGRKKSRVAKPEDYEKKRRRAKKLQNIQKSLGESVNGKTAKKSKAKLKAHFAKIKKQGRKVRGTYSEFVVNADGTTTSMLAKDRKNW